MPVTRLHGLDEPFERQDLKKSAMGRLRVGGAVGWATATVGVQLALALYGAAYEHVAETSDALDYPPPGQLMDIGGYRLHLLCVGSGTPTVVLEAAHGGAVAHWVRV